MKKGIVIRIIIVIFIALLFYFLFCKNIFIGDPLKDFVKVEDKDNSSLGQPYVGTLYIPRIKLTRGFVSNETNDLSCMDTEVCSYNYFEQKPKFKKSKVVLGNSRDEGKNSYFANLKKLKTGDRVYVEVDNVVYEYKYYYIEKHASSFGDMTYGPKNKRQLLLVATSNIHNNLVLHFNYISSKKIK